MDISSLYGSSALDSTAYTNAANQTASKLQDKLNSSDYSKATDDELMDACKQFESYFLEQMFKEMMKTIPESEDTSSSNSQLMDYYKDEMVQQIASDSTEQNSLGLAQMLYEQMKRNYNLEQQNKQFLDSIGAIIKENLTNDNFEMDVIARSMGMSLSALFKKLKAVTGETPSDFVKNYKLNHAVELLKQGSVNITEVAYQSGFSDVSYFGKCFRKRFGMSPREYINSQKK